MKARKSFFLFYALLFATNLYGQKKFNVITLAMPERTFLINERDKEIAEASLLNKLPSYSTALGIILRHQIKGRSYFNYGLMYSYQGQKLNMNFSNLNNHKGKTILSYLKIPMLVQYNFLNKENFSMFIQAGPQISLLIIEEGAIVKGTDIVEVGGGYRPVVLDGVASIGMECKIWKNLFYILQLRFDHSLHYVNNTSYKNIDGAGPHYIYDALSKPWAGEHNMTIGLLNGVSFKVR
jgi:hypothetical protein